MQRVAFTLSAFFCLLSAQESGPSPLPVRRVVLYKNGVGYFEHLGRIHGSDPVTITFTSGQLNDVLKSLTALDLNGGRITGVGYNSSAPAARQLAALNLPAGNHLTLTEFLSSLRGARVEIRSGTGPAATGRILSVERKTRAGNGATLEVDYVALITDTGEVRTTEVSPQFSVRLLDKGLPGKVDQYLDLIASAREPDVRQMVISTEGTGDRSLFVSYISEVPVWKSTYRIVLDSKTGKAPLLQGWAIVDNTIGQDWEKVDLSLVAGAPQSFVQNISQPVYARRPEVEVAVAENLRPQTFQSTLIQGGARVTGRVTDSSGAVLPGATVKVYSLTGELVGQSLTTPSGEYDIGALPASQVRVEASAPGFQTERSSLELAANSTARTDLRLSVGSSSQTVEVSAQASVLSASSSAIGGARRFAIPSVSQLRAAQQSAATTRNLGDLFEYKLKEPVTIGKNRSALVPIVQTSIVAEKVSVWNEQSGLSRPMRALWLTNSNSLTLDGGSFSVIEDETFSGEGIFEPIRPSEKRLVSYAVDLSMNITSKIDSGTQRITRVRIAKGVMTHETETRERKTYTVRNEDPTPRTALIEHPLRPGFTLQNEAKPDEITTTAMRFRVPVAPKSTATFTVEEASPAFTTWQVSDLNTDQITGFAAGGLLNPQTEQALRNLIAQQELKDRAEEEKEKAEGEIKTIVQDQTRLRENMKALKGTPEEKALTLRYTQQLNAQEDELAKLRAEVKLLDARLQRESDKYQSMLEAIVLDLKLQ